MEKNNFDSVRICLALIVVLAHIYALTLFDEFSFLERIFDSNFAVKGFFAISGYLVTLSYFSSRSHLVFYEKRIRRIYPAYILAVCFCLIIGAVISQLSILDFLKSYETIKYLISNALFLNFIQPSLPTVFHNHPIVALNGALWTIKVEVMLYLCLPMIIFFYKRIGLLKTTITIFILSVIWVYFFTFCFNGVKGEEIARQFPGQLSYFIVGSFLAVNHQKIKISLWITLLSIIALCYTSNPIARLIINPLAYTIIVIFLSTNALPKINAGKFGDISYGIYLFHFPIIQLMLHLELFAPNPWFGFSVSLLTTLLFATCSWHFVEKRFLKRNSHYVTSSMS